MREREQTPGQILSSEVPTSPQAEKAPVGTCVAGEKRGRCCRRLLLGGQSGH